MAHHLAGADDEVLQHLVERVADVQVAVGVGRAVVQHEGRAAVGGLAQAVVDAEPLPAGEPVGLAVRQAGAHREVGLREEQGVLVVDGLGWSSGHPVWGRGRARGPGGPERSSERRDGNSDADGPGHGAGV